MIFMGFWEVVIRMWGFRRNISIWLCVFLLFIEESYINDIWKFGVFIIDIERIIFGDVVWCIVVVVFV